MMSNRFTPSQSSLAVCLWMALCLSCSGVQTMANPIGKVARVFNSQLVKVEERMGFLNHQLVTLAVHDERPLKTGIGYRGTRPQSGGADPSVTLDLGMEVGIDVVYLVPVQQEYSAQMGIFPKVFSIEISNDEDFTESSVVFSSGRSAYPDSGGKPVRIMGHGRQGRYLRLTVQTGNFRGGSEVFGLSELVVISDGQPVSFGAKVSSVGALNAADLWYPEALTDGRMPLGVWQSGEWATHEEKGDLVTVGLDDEEVVWGIDFGNDHKVERLILFPYQIMEMLEAGVLPEQIVIEARRSDEEGFREVLAWDNPLQGSNHGTPLILPLGGLELAELRLRGIKARKVGEVLLHGLSEIEVWSGGRNIAVGRVVTRQSGAGRHEVANLTNGFASERQIIPVASWLNQLHDRWRVEREIVALKPLQIQMAAESELNATWGSAMVLGLTFLIPVFVVERRRLIAKNQIDQLRKRIASDLHDDIGSNLGSISLIARTARKDLVRLSGPEEVAEDLNEVESIARESSLAMRDIVWLLELKQDSIGDLVQRMRETAGRLLRELDYTIECDSEKTAAKLSLDAKRHLFLFYKEAIHNILKHAKADKVSIRLWDEGEKLALRITDNGQGLPTENLQGKEVHGAVRKLDERARVIAGQLTVKSKQGMGTKILLMVKRSHLMAAQLQI